MIAGGSTTLIVSDLDRAVRFYVETLGFKLRAREGENETAYAEVDGGDGVVLGLHPSTGRVNTKELSERGSMSIRLVLNQPIAEVFEVLSNRGVAFHGAIREDGPLKLAFFADPDGNVLYLFERAPNVRTTSG